jgi:hypothetical protein
LEDFLIKEKEFNLQMTKKQLKIAIPQEIILNKIYEIRGQKVMLDSPDSYRDSGAL